MVPKIFLRKLSDGRTAGRWAPPRSPAFDLSTYADTAIGCPVSRTVLSPLRIHGHPLEYRNEGLSTLVKPS